jgi:hypothetical protein
LLFTTPPLLPLHSTRSSIARVLVHHHVIDRPDTRVLGKVDMHAGAGRDATADSFALAVEDVSGSFETELARALAVNHECVGRLIACHL